MQFSIIQWLKIYDEVQKNGQMLKDSYPTHDDNKKVIPPVCELSIDVQINLKKIISNLTHKCSKYLDACGINPCKPLWQYDIKDPTTWASDESFKFAHLIENKQEL